MSFIESIGPVLGIVAFVGLAALAFLLFQQARDLRRLREWAGRAPERAQEAAEAVQAAGDASRGEGQAGVGGQEEAEAPPPGRLGAAWARLTGAVAPRLARFERRLPVDGRYLLAVAAIAVIVAGVLTGGFGLFGGDDGKRQRRGSGPKPTVAVLNATDVPGLAALVDKQVVRPAGYKAGAVDNAGSSLAATVAMFAPGHQADAKRLAKAIRTKLGDTPTDAMTTEATARARGAPVALVVGLDDSEFGG